jgi:hypothetical protein
LQETEATALSSVDESIQIALKAVKSDTVELHLATDSELGISSSDLCIIAVYDERSGGDPYRRRTLSHGRIRRPEATVPMSIGMAQRR